MIKQYAVNIQSYIYIYITLKLKLFRNYVKTFAYYMWVKVTLFCLAVQSMEFSRPEYRSGWPFPSPGDLSNQGIKPRFLTLQTYFFFFFFYQLKHKGSPRILVWVAYPFPSGSYWRRNQTGVSCIAGGFFTNWVIREAPLVPWPGIKPLLPAVEAWSLTIGQPGKSRIFTF